MDNEQNRISRKKMSRTWILDLILVIVCAIIVYFFASAYDILERIADFSARHEEWELDEFVTVSIFLVVALSVFAFRRWLEIRDINDILFHRNKELDKALSEIKLLRGILPICAACKRIRDDAGYWHQVELYIREHTEAEFSHSICPDCMRKLYPDFFDDESSNENTSR